MQTADYFKLIVKDVHVMDNFGRNVRFENSSLGLWISGKDVTTFNLSSIKTGDILFLKPKNGNRIADLLVAKDGESCVADFVLITC